MSYWFPDTNSFMNYIYEIDIFSFLTTFYFVAAVLYIVLTFFHKHHHIPQYAKLFYPPGSIHAVLAQDTTMYIYLWKYYEIFRRKGYEYGELYLFSEASVLIVDPILMKKNLSEEVKLVDVYRNNVQIYVSLFNHENLDDFFFKFNDIKDTLIEDLKEKSVTTAMYNFFMKTTCAAFGFKNKVEVWDVINGALEEKNLSSVEHYANLVYGKRRFKSTYDLYILIKNTIEFRKQNDIREKDLIQRFIDFRTNAITYSLEEIVPELSDIIVDNLIYSYSTVLFCLHALASDEYIQGKLTDEIRRFNKEYKSFNVFDLETLKYLDAVVKETLRKYPPIPTVVKRCKENYKVPEFNLEFPKGTFILASIFGIHHDPRNFESPEKFKPSRFFEEKGHTKPNAYLPFEIDIMKTIGFRLICMPIKLGIISFLSSYKVNIDKNYVLEFDTAKVSVSPKEPLPLTVEPL